MFTPRQSLYVKGHAGDPLPTVWPDLETQGTRFLRGQLCLVCAGPGTGKSAFVLSYALRAGVPTLYFSADSDAFVQLSRSLSVVTGMHMAESTQIVRNEDLGQYENLFDELPIRFTYNASPSLDNIEQTMLAYEEVYGDFPMLVIIDNITNVRGTSDEDDPFSGLESLMDYFHTMARNTGACVIGLHHVTGGYNDADQPIPLSGVKGQITRVPEMVLTLHKIESYPSDILGVSTVKNRGGKADPSGRSVTQLDFDPARMKIG